MNLVMSQQMYKSCYITLAHGGQAENIHEDYLERKIGDLSSHNTNKLEHCELHFQYIPFNYVLQYL